MASSHYRSLPVSGMENFYLALEADDPFYLEWVLEYSALPNVDWPSVLKSAAKINPAAVRRAKIGWLGANWLPNNKAIPFREIQTRSSLLSTLDKVPTDLSHADKPIELIKIHHPNGVALLFRCLHSLMDGIGAWHWLCDCIALANGQQPKGQTSVISDGEFCRGLTGVAHVDLQRTANYQPLTAGAVPVCDNFIQMQVPGQTRGLSRFLAGCLRDYAQLQGITDLNIMIPSDLRKYQPEIATSGNLTGVFSLRFNSGCSDEELDELYSHAKTNRTDAGYAKRMGSFKRIPIGLMRKSLKKGVKTGRYSTTAFVSNVGELNADDICVQGHAAKNAFILPPRSKSQPLFMIMSAMNGTITMNISVPPVQHGTAKDLCDFIRQRLISRTDQTTTLEATAATVNNSNSSCADV